METKSKRVVIKTKNIDNEKYKFREYMTNVKEVKIKSIHLHNSFYNISESLGNNKVTLRYTGTLPPTSYVTFWLEDGFYDNLWTTIQDKLNFIVRDTSIPIEFRGKIKFDFSYDKNVNKVTIYSSLQENIDRELSIKSKALKLLGFNKDTITLLSPSMEAEKYGKYIRPDLDLSNVVYTSATSDIGVKLSPYNEFYVHCDIDSDREFNGKQSKITCVLPVDQTKRWWDTVSYNNLDYKFISDNKEVNGINLCIVDENGNNISFSDYPVIYELEITQELVQKPVQNELNKDVIFDAIATEIGKRIKDKFPYDTNEELD